MAGQGPPQVIMQDGIIGSLGYDIVQAQAEAVGAFQEGDRIKISVMRRGNNFSESSNACRVPLRRYGVGLGINQSIRSLLQV